MDTMVHPLGWGRACRNCGLIGVVLADPEAEASPPDQPPPELPRVRWICPGCQATVQLRPTTSRDW
jgi:hypothetical protein